MILRSPITIVSVLAFGATTFFPACSSQGNDPGDAATEAGNDAAADGEKPDGRDASSDAPAGAVCGFNRECASNMRCECLDGDCACAVGPRGTGKNGVTKCTSGN
ncbi:MAG: hypothetical protein KBF88_10625, partial [Polyangiaceae bacterium]|nr:hypothetical protein [Polyangiaceae bacterium]